jgi:serine O-acetyltransferase
MADDAAQPPAPPFPQPKPAGARAPEAAHAEGAALASSDPDREGLAPTGPDGTELDGTDLDALARAFVASYRGDARGSHIGRCYRPSREEILEIVRLLLQLFYPGYHGANDITDETAAFHVGSLLATLRTKLARQIEMCLCSEAERHGQVPPCAGKARELTARFLARLPGLRAMLLDDVQASYDGDPAASGLDEILLAYPGLLAVSVYRVAHELHALGVPLMPRIMSEWAHTQTGADIHPGATIGRRFFIDHATGVVIGETTVIGDDVKLYQGVTLGALSHPKDAQGRVVRHTKRHPTVESGVTIYASATVLGGDTVVGEGSLIGGSVFLTRSVPPRSRVAVKPPELSVRQAGAPTKSDWEI